MKIKKGNIFRPCKSEFGDFEIVPEDGWKMSQAYIDYESKLLIVSLSIIDESKWIDSGFGGRIIPTKEYKVDLSTLRILERDEWKSLFNYEPVEIVSNDKKYKLISQRIFEEEANNDSIKEELYDLTTGELISKGASVAFQEKKRENLLEKHYNRIGEAVQRKKELDAKLSLEEFYKSKLDSLKDKDVIIVYSDHSGNVFRLVFIDSNFQLSSVKNNDKQSQDYRVVKTFGSIDEFWQYLTKDDTWYMDYSIDRQLSENPLILAKHVNQYFNNIREKQEFTFAEYRFINEWSAGFWSDDYKRTELKQWCPDCHKEVSYYPRYPKFICSDCSSKDKFDKKGNYLYFSNIGFSGGLKVTYKDGNGNIIKEDTTLHSCDCIIDGKLYFAQEARFGGIVIQKKDDSE